MRETARAAAADGITLDVSDQEEMFQLLRDFDSIPTSMLVDKRNGRGMELEAIPGAVLSRSRALGIEAPYTETVYTLLSSAIPK